MECLLLKASDFILNREGSLIKFPGVHLIDYFHQVFTERLTRKILNFFDIDLFVWSVGRFLEPAEAALKINGAGLVGSEISLKNTLGWIPVGIARVSFPEGGYLFLLSNIEHGVPSNVPVR